MAFRVGQLVCCIKEGVWKKANREGFIHPDKGGIYTIRTIESAVAPGYEGRILLRFEEIINEPCRFLDGFKEIQWLGDWFRPLTRRNIEIVESLKAPPPADLDLDPLRPEEVAFQ